jgi:hypothetical protein
MKPFGLGVAKEMPIHIPLEIRFPIPQIPKK